MKFLPESAEERISCYGVLDDSGQLINGSTFQDISKELAVKMYSQMITLMDTIFYESQGQGRTSMYIPSTG
ncbi:hypothetical protein QJS04_geneDACA009228 [Acorus gramineus]|uniref:Uncharacterized protein n=1 Tax=Acorus gramineus TaxID=55184 RepID=A0AAV9AII4_ACOGR|nr:hypothetical protein QJS04_geneDACA009228 [Acorus gramineus]